MNILVFSDSHGRADNLSEALRRQIQKPAAIIFLGDGICDLEVIESYGVPIYSVSGNCDSRFEAFFPNVCDEQLITLCGKRIFITHGHKYHVKSVMSSLLVRAVKLSADIVLFGHTHQAFEMTLLCDNDLGIKTEKPMSVMNPGSIGEYPCCFGNIEIDKDGRVLLSHGRLK